MPALWQYAALSSHVYSDIEGDDPENGYFLPDGFTVVESFAGANGLFARVYRETSSGKTIVVARGTQPTDVGDLETNVGRGAGHQRAPGQFNPGD